MLKFLGTAQDSDKTLLYFLQEKEGYHQFNVVSSENGFEFGDDGKSVIVTDNKFKVETEYDWTSLRVSKQGDKHLLTYKNSLRSNSHLQAATTSDLVNFEKLSELKIKETGTVVPDFKYKNHHAMYFGEKNIKLAYSRDLAHWKAEKEIVLAPRQSFFDSADLEVGNAFEVDNQILLTYYVKKTGEQKKQHF